MTARPHGNAPHGARSRGRSAPAPAQPGVPSLSFLAVEVEAYLPGTPAVAVNRPRGSHPRGALARRASVLETTATLRGSDLGYRTAAGEAGAAPGAVQVYPAIVASAFALDRAVTLPPSADVGSFAVGSLSLLNAGGRFDAIAGSWNSDGRPARILSGRKGLNRTLGVWTDPVYAALDVFWSGVAQSWQLSESELTIPLRDPAYLLQRPLQSAMFQGTGGLEGGADLAGKPRPMLRGTALNITPILVDPVNQIWQVSDAPGQILAVSEGGDPTNIVSGGVVPDITASAPGAGHYLVESSSRGLFVRLATKPVYGITVDAVGAFQVAGQVGTVIGLVRYLLAETVGLAPALLDLGAFIGADAAYPYQAGVWFGTDSVTAAEAVGPLLASIGAKLISGRSGRLRPFVLRAPAVGVRPVDTWTPAQLVGLTPHPLPDGLDPPPASWNVGYARNYTTQTSNLDPDVVGTARETWLAAAYRTGGWSAPAVAAAWRNANRPAMVGGQLAAQGDAQTVAAELGALWAPGNNRRRLYVAELPVSIAAARELGDVVVVSYPMDDLRGGRLGVIVAEEYRSQDATIQLTVLV